MWEKRMREGSIWYVVSMKWFTKWQTYVHAAMGGEHPGRVDNSDLLADLNQGNQYLVEKRADSLWQNTYFQREIAENRDYLLLNEEVWEFFVGIHGCEPDQVIQRYAIAIISKHDDKELPTTYVEVNLRKVKVFVVPNSLHHLNGPAICQVSLTETKEGLFKKVKRLLNNYLVSKNYRS